MGRPMGIYREGQPIPEEGFTLLGVLFLVALLALGLASLGRIWHHAELREKEAQLLYVGDEYRRALESYYRATPGKEKRYPKTLDELLQDKRYPYPVRHLRRLYRDPLTNADIWGLEKQGEEIRGIYSLASGTPLKLAGFPRAYEDFEGKTSYRGWAFVAFPKGFAMAPEESAAVQATKALPKVPSLEERKRCEEERAAGRAACQQSPELGPCMLEVSKAYARCAYGI